MIILDLDKAEWLDEIEKGDSSLKAFLAMVEESIGEREREKFVEGLNSKEGRFSLRSTCMV